VPHTVRRETSPYRAALTEARSPPRSSRMTIEEVEDIEDIIRALTAVVESLEASAAKQAMQEAFVQVRAYAGETLVPARGRPPGQQLARSSRPSRV
jgi:hypothetical protein